MSERHVLMHRPLKGAESISMGEYRSYKAALFAGMQQCEHGTWWVDSQKRAAKRWIERCPDPEDLRLRRQDMESQVLDVPEEYGPEYDG